MADPSSPALSTYHGSFNNPVASQQHSAAAAILYSELQSECLDLDRAVSLLASFLESSLLSFISSSKFSCSSFVYLNSLSLWLRSITRNSSHTVGSPPKVTEVKTFYVYRESAMKLIMLIGEIQDYASSDENKRRTTKLKQKAINTLEVVVCTFSEISDESPEWRGFLTAADESLEEAVEAIKPHAVAQFRNFLTSLNISFSNHCPFETKLGLQIHQIFTSFCQFQRTHAITNSNCPLSQLWVTEELANHLFTSCRDQFLKWSDDPKLIFDQSFKFCEDYAPFMDETLQPIVDEVELWEYICIDEWVSCWIAEFSTFLREELLPLYKDRSFIKAVELMFQFDNQIRSLLSCYSFCENVKNVSLFSDAMDRPDLIEYWANLKAQEAIKAVSRDLE